LDSRKLGFPGSFHDDGLVALFPDPMGFSLDPLTVMLRSVARGLIEQAAEAELVSLLASHADDKTEDGRSRVIRHGYLPEREVMTGIGPVSVKGPRSRKLPHKMDVVNHENNDAL